MNDDVLPTVSIVVPAFNEGKYIEQCIESLLALDYPKDLITITIVDNGSTDDTVQKAEKHPVTVLIKKGGKVGGVRNYGVYNSDGEVLAFIDGDCIAGPLWLKAAVLKLQKGSGAIGGNYLLRENPSWVESAWVIENSPLEGKTKSLVGGSFILTRKLFNKLGGFDEIINAGEDTKLTKAVLSDGKDVEFLKQCAVIHLGYPNVLSSFIKRQFWHASSFVKSNNGFLNDKTFVFTLLFVLSFISLLVGWVTNTSIAFYGGGFLILSPIAFSVNRLRKCGNPKVSLILLLQMICLDFFYCVGRGGGLLTSLIYDPYKK